MTETLKEKAEGLAKRLERFDLDASAYSRGPLGSETFTLNMSPSNVIRVWPANAEVEVAGSKRHRQAVLTVDERARVVRRTYSLTVWAEGTPTLSLIRERARQMFPIHVPNSRFTLENHSLTSTVHPLHPNRKSYKVTASRQTRGVTHSCFLAGMDETAQFIAVLPQDVSSVAEAHDLLRPASVPKKTLRQGEWFLTQATPAQLTRIERHLRARDGRNISQAVGYRPLERGSSHWATTVRARNTRGRLETFAIGLVADTRTDHHQPLILPTWHLVTRNLEVVQTRRSDIQVSRRFYD